MWLVDFVNDNTLTVILRPREKTGRQSTKPTLIQTVRGLGYVRGEGMSRNKEFFIFMSIQFIFNVFSNYRLSDRECTLRAFCIRDAGVNVDCFFYVSSLAIHSNSEAF